MSANNELKRGANFEDMPEPVKRLRTNLDQY